MGIKTFCQYFPCIASGADDHALFLGHIGEQDVQVLHVLLVPCLFQVGIQQLFCPVKVLAGHVAALRHPKTDIAAHEHLKVLQEHFLGGLAVQPLSCLEHLVGKLLNVHPGDLCQPFGGVYIHGGAGGAAEGKRVGQDGAQQQTGGLLGDLHPVFIVHLGDDGGGTAHRLVAEIHRSAGLQTADAVMVDDLQDLRLFKTLHCLGRLVVVHQNDPALAEVDDVPAADHTAVFALFVQNGEIAVAHLCHDPGHIRHRGHEGEFDDVLPGHVIGDGGALADELAGCVGVTGGGHDRHPGLLCNALDGASHLCPVADDNERGFLFDGAQLALVAVGEDDDIPFFHAVFQHFRGGGANADVPGGACSVLAAHHHGRPQRLQNVPVAGAALGKDAGIKKVHVGGGDILDRNDAFQLVIRVGHRQSVDLLVPHDLPRLPQTGGAGDPRDLTVIHVPDLGVYIGTHPGRRDPKLFQDELGLLIHLSGSARLADQIAGLVFQLCIGDRRADGVGIRIPMSDDHYLVGCFGHKFSPFIWVLPFIIRIIFSRCAPALQQAPGLF